MQSLQAHCQPLRAPGRRLTAQKASVYGASSIIAGQGINTRLSRVHAAETLGSGVDRVHDVRRRSLKQSFELDSAAPEGHLDNTLTAAAAAAAAANPSITTSRGRRTRSSNSSSSNGNGTSAAAAAGSIRRLGSSRSRSAAARSSSSSSTSAAVAEQPAAAAAVQQEPAVVPQPEQQQQQEQQAPPQQQQQQQTSQAEVPGDDPDSDRELQAEFRESMCCQDVLDIIADELDRFSPFHTVTALNRLAKLGKSLPWQQRSAVLKDPNFILLLDRLVRQAPLLNPFQLSVSMWSCAVLQIPLYSLKTGTFSQLLPAFEAGTAAQIKQFNDRDVSNSMYAYAQLKPHTAVDLQQKSKSYATIMQLAGHAQSLIARNEMSGQSLSMVLWSLATLHGGSSGSGIAAGSSALVAAAAQQLLQNNTSFDELGSQIVANSIWAAEKLGHHDVQLLQKGCDWMAKNPQRCKVQEVLNVLWAAGAARYRPKLLGTLAKHIAGQSKALKPADVASLFHVLGIFGFEFDTPSNQPLLDTLLPRASDLLPQMKPSEVTSLYWGLGMTKQVDNTLFQQITTVVAKLQQQQQQQQAGQQQQQRVPHMPASLQRQAFQAFIAAKLADVPVELPSDVIAAFRSAWLAGGSSSRQQQQRQRVRPMLEELQWMLQSFKVKAKVNGRSKLDGLITVDLELTASGQRSVAIQILDEHDVDSQGQRLAPILWEEDLLLRNGYDQVYWLQVSDYKRCPKEKRPRFMADVLRRVGVNPQERLIAAAENAWVAAGCKAPAAAAAAAAGWGLVGAGGIRASEVDVLMQDRGSSSSDGSGGYASGGGRGSRRNVSRRRR